MSPREAEAHEPVPPRLHLDYSNQNSDASAKELVYTIQPKWRKSPGDIEIIKFTDGITNTLLKLTKHTPGTSKKEQDADAVLMRAYGNNTEILIDRDREAKSHSLLAVRNLAPPLLARFDNGLLYRFIPGQVCTARDLTQEPVYRGIARRLAEWHARLPIDAVQQDLLSNGVDGEHTSYTDGVTDGETDGISSRVPKINIWSVILKWVNALPDQSSAQRSRKHRLRLEIERSYHDLDSTQSLGKDGFVFGHCDLLSANVIMLPQSTRTTSHPKPTSHEPATTPVSFIDYEYATPCPAAFDIANHFAEWGGYDCDYTMLPTRSTRQAFVSDYMHAYYSHHHLDSLPSPSQNEIDTQIETLMHEIDAFRGMPGLYWGVWALIQATISQIDFDYASYAEIRLGEYWAWRAEVDGSRAAENKEMPLRERRWAEE